MTENAHVKPASCAVPEAATTGRTKCVHGREAASCVSCARPRWKDYLLALWCLTFDWTEGMSTLYRGDKRGPLVWIGGMAQTVWFRAHNNRVYNWLDGPHQPLCWAVRDGSGPTIRCGEEAGHDGPHEGELTVKWGGSEAANGWAASGWQTVSTNWSSNLPTAPQDDPS